MKLLLFASMTPIATANYFIKVFRDLGHEVLVCSDVQSPFANVRVLGAVEAGQIIEHQGFEPDAVLFFEGGTMQLLPVGFEKVGCITAWYGIDTHMDYAKHLRICRLFDVSFIAQKEYVEKLRKDGIRQVHWLPLAFAPELMPMVLPARAVDIAYVGSDNATMHPQRHALLAALRREFASTRFGMATPGEMGGIYASARLVFNRSVNNDVNMRFFEAAGAGAVLVTDPIRDNGVDELFVTGEHYVIYQDESSLLDTVRRLLADPARIDRIGAAARQQVMEHHTYRHRALQLMDSLDDSHKMPPPEYVDVFAAAVALRMTQAALVAAGQALQAGGGSRLQRLLSGMMAIGLFGLAFLAAGIDRLRRIVRRG